MLNVKQNSGILTVKKVTIETNESSKGVYPNVKLEIKVNKNKLVIPCTNCRSRSPNIMGALFPEILAKVLKNPFSLKIVTLTAIPYTKMFTIINDQKAQKNGTASENDGLSTNQLILKDIKIMKGTKIDHSKVSTLSLNTILL